MTIPEQIKAFISSKTYQEMKSKKLSGAFKYSYGGLADLRQHFSMLKDEFIGKTELELAHALLIVLIRREIDLATNVERFNMLWHEEGVFLSQHLDSRWLVSACDTIIDHGARPEDRAVALAGALFANTIKLYETEHWALELGDAPLPYKRLPRERLALHDGMSGFMIGQGNMIANLYRRAESLLSTETPAALIVSQLLSRATEHNTVYSRFRRVHENPETIWLNNRSS